VTAARLSALLQQGLALRLPVMTVRQGAGCHLVAGNDAHRILERIEASPAVLHDRLELQDLALQCQHTGRQVLCRRGSTPAAAVARVASPN
jgi:hypothetical protein